MSSSKTEKFADQKNGNYLKERVIIQNDPERV